MASEDDICWGGRNAQLQRDAQRLWLQRMGERGWTVPDLAARVRRRRPVGRRGPGAGAGDARAELPQRRWPASASGCSGPALLKFGNEAQKREHLPKIARGEIRWCQGYSEPNAGSDLASLATRAEDHGDHFLVNGQKIWTSYADKADWIFCLVRTDSAAKKHTGISFVLFDMASAGRQHEADRADLRQVAVLRDLLRQRARATSTTSSARPAAAGTWPSTC